MILVTGGTGFVGRALIRQLVANGQQVRTLIRPSPRTPNLPRGVQVEVAVAGLGDERGLRAALRGVDTIYHLAGAEHQGARANILQVDGHGTANLAQAAAEMRVRRFFYVSHLGADRSSYFPLLKVKGIAEEHIRRSGVPYTIFRTALLYGPEDHFTTAFARILSFFPIVMLPREGQVLLQPLWVEDLVTCLIWSPETPETLNRTIDIGGSEYFPFRQAIEIIQDTLGKRRWLLPLGLPYLRTLTVMLESLLPGFPFSTFWVDYFAYNRTCPVDAIPRMFGFLPARFTYRLEHLKGVNWNRLAWQTFLKRAATK
ncbi:MAG TPA: NAD(P)H-binding protein [Anaerolineales bacterium]|jgi:NADH dehydrogenase